MIRAILVAATSALLFASLALAQPSTWQSLGLERGQTFSVTCADEITLLHIERGEIVGHCGAGGTVPPDHSVFWSPLRLPAGASTGVVASDGSELIYMPLIVRSR